MFNLEQTHDNDYSTTADWDESGSKYFSGNAVVDSHKELTDWTLVIVFDSPVVDIEVWNSEPIGNSYKGHVWTLGPHSWNTALSVGLFDVSFVAKMKYMSNNLPNGKDFYCQCYIDFIGFIFFSIDLPL